MSDDWDTPSLTDGDGEPIPHEYTTDELIAKLTSGDEFTELIGMRDFLIHELTVSRCRSCQASKLRTGDTAALSKRLSDTLERIEVLRRKRAVAEAAANGEVKGVAAIRGRRGDPGRPATSDSASPKFGTKSSPRRPAIRRDSRA